ncbi:MAG: ABC transporter substrate-binding protein, partial [Acetobacteraceae bacterium]|nr:ABC transporter substrate-binding protein [Acetobacteraceae bacterium]
MQGFRVGRRPILAGAALLATPGLLRAQNEPIRIGEINSYTAQPAFLIPYRNAWIMAQEAVNAAGGINGRRIETTFR